MKTFVWLQNLRENRANLGSQSSAFKKVTFYAVAKSHYSRRDVNTSMFFPVNNYSFVSRNKKKTSKSTAAQKVFQVKKMSLQLS